MAMIGKVDWAKVETRDEDSPRGDSDSIYIKFAPGKFKVRPIGSPYFFLQTFIPKKMTGADKDIAVISPGEGEDPLIKLGILPQQKGAIFVLDRLDGNKLKIMRFGAAIYKHIKNYAVEMKVDPADIKQGIDFLIKVSDPGGNPRNRQYEVTPLGCTPITKDEGKDLKELKASGKLPDFEKLFAPTPLEKINEYIAQYDLSSKTARNSGEDTDFEDSKASKSSKSVSKSDEDEDDDGTEISF